MKDKAKISPAKKIYIGRDRELNILKGLYLDYLEGNVLTAVIAGEPGIGKTCLVEHFFHTHKECHYVHGKNGQLGENDFAAVSQIIEQITNFALTLSKENLRKVQVRLEKTIGNDISLLYRISPSILQVVKHAAKSTNSDLIKTKYRVKNAVLNYISIIVEYCFPLAVFIDDLQWADTLCIEIVKTLVKKIDQANIMLILSFRDNETSELLDSLKPVLEERTVFISVEQYRYADILLYIRQLLPGRFKDIEEFTLLVERMTRGNPFYVDRLLHIFLHDGIIKQNGDEWSISPAKNNRYSSTSAESLISSSIQSYHNRDQFLLDLISCFQDVDMHIIEEISDLNKKEISKHIQDLIEASILTKNETHNSITVAYSHDIISKLVYGKISREQKEDIHYHIASRIMQGIKSEGVDDIAVSHLLQSNREKIAANADEWIDLLFNSGMDRKMIALVEQAGQIFELCIDILPYCQSKDRFFKVQVMLESAECCCLLDKVDEAHKIIAELLENNKDKHIIETIKIKQLYIYHYLRQHSKVIKSGKELLKEMGLRVSKFHMPVNLLGLKRLYSSKGIAGIGSLPDVTDDRLLKALEILTLMTICATLTDDDMSACLCLKAAVYCGKSGTSPSSVVGYVAGAYIMLTVWKDKRKAFMLEEAILKFLEKAEDKYKPFAYFILGTFFSIFSKTLAESESLLDKSVRYGEVTGDFIFLGYSVLSSMDNKAFMGVALEDVMSYIQRIETDYSDLEQNNVMYNLLVNKEHVNALRYGTKCFDENSVSSKFDQLTELEKYTEKGLMLQRMYLLGEKKQAFDLIGKMAEDIHMLDGMISSIDIYLFEALTRIRINDGLAGTEKKRNISRIRQIIRMAEKWSEQNINDFGVVYALITAEYETRINRKPSADYLYNEAVRMAGGNIKLNALTVYLYALSCGNDSIRKHLAGEAEVLFRTWGADAVADLITEEFGFARAEKGEEQKAETFPLAELEKESECLGESDTIRIFIKTLVSCKFADYCAFIFEKADVLAIGFESTSTGNVIQHDGGLDIEESGRISTYIVRHSCRTGKEISYEPDGEKTLYVNDPYLVENTDYNISCLPLKCHGITAGLIYMVKDSGGFDAAIMTSVKRFLPVIASKITTIKGINLKNVFSEKTTKTNLSIRELDVLKFMSKGFTNQQISSELNIALGTVKNHISSILVKLEADSRIKAVNTAKQQNLI